MLGKEGKAAFMVGTVPVDGDLVLSPMDGFSDLPFRSMARRLGSAMSYTEFINAIDVVNGSAYAAPRLRYVEWERPVVFQVFDDDPERLVQAAHLLRARNPDIIDVNMGCSSRCVSARGAGAGLLRSPEKIAAIFSRLSQELDIPVTGKIRLGWDEGSLSYLEVAKAVEENGGKLIAVHGRTRAQGYGGQADWGPIAEVKAAVGIPVLGNGDVRCTADIERMKRETGVDGVMIGRAAVSNPWIFSRLNREDVPVESVRALIREHLQAVLDFYGTERGLVLFRKYSSRYISAYPLNREERTRLFTCTQAGEFLALIDEVTGDTPAEALLATPGRNFWRPFQR